MAKYSIDETTLTGIAGAIRTKKGYSSLHTMTPAQMIEEINSISGGVDVGDDFFLLAENLGSNANGVLTSNLPAGGQIRLIDFDWTAADLNTVKRFYDRLDSMYGVDENGAQESSCVNSISGTITVDKLSTYEYESELSTVSNRYPLVTIEYNDIVEITEVTLKYYNDDGSILLYSEVLAPGEDGTYAETPTKLNTPEFSYTFSGWSLSPGGAVNANALTAVGSDRDVYAAFTTTPMTYTVRFYNESTLLSTINNVALGDTTQAIYDGADPSYPYTETGYSFAEWVPYSVTGPIDAYAGFELSSGLTSTYLTSSFKTIYNGAEKVGNHAFYSMSTLSTALFPNATEIGDSAFTACSYLYRAVFPEASIVGSRAFNLASRLGYVYFPKLIFASDYAFYNTIISNAWFPSLTIAGSNAFENTRLNDNAYFPMLETISTGAFRGCSFVNPTFPKVTTVGRSAFTSCASMQTINLPNAVSVGYQAFYSCRNLVSVSMPLISSIEGSTFQSCPKLETACFPFVKSIGYSAFASCTTLREVSFPLLETIGNSAFYNCQSLVTVSFLNVTHIGSGAFYNCTNLSAISMPQVYNIGENAFYNCRSLVDVSFSQVTSLPSGCFRNCSSLTKVTYQQFIGLEAIGTSAFAGCSNLSCVDWGPYQSKLKEIGGWAFSGCSSLEYVYASGVSKLGQNAFSGCVKLSSVYFGQTFYTIPYGAFCNCKSLPGVPNPFTAASIIEGLAFSGCTFSTVSLNYVLYIGASAFAQCSLLEKAYFPSAAVIGWGAFAGCSMLSDVSFPVVTSIANSAFASCAELTSLSFSFVRGIASGAFSSCTKLTSVFMPEASYIGSQAFLGCTSLTSVSYPEVLNIGSSAFRICYFLDTASFNKVSLIYSSAFASCSRLMSLYLLASSVCGFSGNNVTASNVFSGTPMLNTTAYTGGYGSIFVPESLVSAYQNDQAWYSVRNRITAYNGG